MDHLKVWPTFLLISAALLFAGGVALAYFFKERSISASIGLTSLYPAYAIDLAISDKFDPISDSIVKTGLLRKSPCKFSGNNDEFREVDVDRCYMVNESYALTAEKCWYFARYTTCIGLAIPQRYVTSEAFKAKLIEAIADPCSNIRNRFEVNQTVRLEDLMREISCTRHDSTKPYDVYIAVVGNDWDENPPPRKFGNNSDVLEIFHSSKGSRRVIKLR